MKILMKSFESILKTFVVRLLFLFTILSTFLVADQVLATPPYQVVCYTLDTAKAGGGTINWTTDVPWNDLTVVADAFYQPNTGNTFTNQGVKGTNLITAAHNNGVRCVVSLGGAGQDGAFKTLCLSANRASFASAVSNLVSTKGYDGVDIDWETPQNQWGNGATAADATAMMQLIYQDIKALPVAYDNQPRTVSFATVDYVFNVYTMASMSSCTDWLFYMGYDWFSGTGSNGPLAGENPSISTTIPSLSYPASKIILGCPLYANNYNAGTEIPVLTCLTSGTAGTYNSSWAEQAYNVSGATVYVDTAQSYCTKINWANGHGLKGIGMWDLAQGLPYTNAAVTGIWSAIGATNSCVTVGGSTPTKTNTPVPPTNTPTKTNTLTPTKTNTPVPPTNTFTSSPTKTNTPVPPTSTFTKTNTPVPPTNTFTNTFTKTNTPVPPTSTFTNTSTKTNTPVPPTNTATATFTNTPVPPTSTFTKTNTPVPPTSTFTNTSTKTNTPVPPTNTATATFTNTPVPPTSTFTKTNTPVPPTSTFTNTPTKTNTGVPPTNTFTSTNTPVPPTNTSTKTNTPTNTPIVPTNTFTNTWTSTNTPVPPTNTFTNTPTKTNTPVPPTNTFTNTPVPPTNTPTNTAVGPTNTFTNTSTNTWTSTNTAVPPTSTPTNSPVPSTNTATPTNTSAPPTNTRTNTPVPPTNSFTNTPVPPTATSTATRTSSFTPTSTFSPTVTNSNTSTRTPTPSFTFTRSFTATASSTPSFTPTSTATFTRTPTPSFTPSRNGTPVVYPNPVSGPGPVNVRLPLSSASDVKIKIYTTAFRLVNSLSFGTVQPGQDVTVPLTNKWGNPLASGVYYLWIEAGGKHWVIKLMVLR